MSEVEASSHRLFQFRLRTVLVAFLAISIPLGWFTARLRKAHRQQAAVQAIQESHGRVIYDYEWNEGEFAPSGQPSYPVWLRESVGDDFLFDVIGVAWDDPYAPSNFFDDEALTYLLSLPGLRSLSLRRFHTDDLRLAHLSTLTTLKKLTISNKEVTDAGLVHLKGLAELEELDLWETGVTGSGLVHLTGLTKLSQLSLSHSKVTSDALTHIGKISTLEGLCLLGNDIGDSGLEHIAQQRNLKMLFLSNTNVTDAGLIHLKPLINLEILSLDGNHITDAGVDHLTSLTGLRMLQLKSLPPPAGTENGNEWPKETECQITLDGLGRLHEALPECLIDY